MIFGDRVKQLREMHSMTQLGLADAIPGLTQSHISRIEKDQSQPDDESVALLAATLGVAPEFFSRPPSAELSAHSPQLRARSRLTQRSKMSALQWGRLVYEQHERLRELANPLPVRLPTLYGVTPSAAAKEIRALLGFSQNQPLPYLVLAAERVGVTVLGLPISDGSLDAYCAWRGEEPIVGLLDGVPGDRLRFSLAHELGHLVMHRLRDVSRDIEVEADAFAAELLTPLDAIANEMPSRPTLSSLTMLKTRWGVSVKSLIRRARELQVIDQDRATSLYRQISSRGWNRAEPGHVPREKPRALRKLAEISYGPVVKVSTLAKDAGWSDELALMVLAQHATSDELPFEPGPSRQHLGDNVVDFQSARRRA